MRRKPHSTANLCNKSGIRAATVNGCVYWMLYKFRHIRTTPCILKLRKNETDLLRH